MCNYTADVYPTVIRYARRWFGTQEDRVAGALTYSWALWKRSGQRYGPAAIAFFSCKAAASGRDAAGLPTDWARDLARAPRETLTGSPEQLADRRPGPARTAAGEDLVEQLRLYSTPRMRELLDLLLGEPGLTNIDAGRAMGVTHRKVARLRRALAARARKLS